MAERVRRGAFARLLLWLLAAGALVDLAEAQGRHGKGGGKGGAQEWGAGAGGQGGGDPAFGGGTGGLPGFDAPSAGPKKGARGKGGAPHGPSPKAGAKKPVPPPPDPLKEADLVTAVADHQAEVDEAEQKLLREHFKVCDLDGNGWLSLRELEITLSLTRDEYRRTDTNQDGRVDPAEFAAQKALFFARLGAAPRPEPKEKSEPPLGAEPAAPVAAQPTPPAPSADAQPDKPAPRKRRHTELEGIYPRPMDLLTRYDADKSKGLDASEIQKLLLEIGLSLSAEQLVASMDPDGSGQLEANELVGLAWMASQHLPKALRPDAAPAVAAQPPAASEDSDGPAPSDADMPVASAAPAAATAAKGQALTHFGRLDADHDGFIGESDLRTLQNPVRIELRLSAMLAVLDKDGDGKLSEAEFRAAMGETPR